MGKRDNNRLLQQVSPYSILTKAMMIDIIMVLMIIIIMILIMIRTEEGWLLGPMVKILTIMAKQNPTPGGLSR